MSVCVWNKLKTKLSKITNMHGWILQYFLELTQLYKSFKSTSGNLTLLHHICGFNYEALLITTGLQFVFEKGSRCPTHQNTTHHYSHPKLLKIIRPLHHPL